MNEAAEWIVRRWLRPVVRDLAIIFLHSPGLSIAGRCECPVCAGAANRELERIWTRCDEES